jgi:uncharacterized membrane protein
MSPDNDRPAEPTIFSAVLTPHRSLGRTGFLILMLVLCVANLATGIAFMLAGAWPIFGFCGLDVLLVYVAFRASYRVREWTFNPVWARLHRDVHEEFGIERLFLVSHGRRLAIAACLGPREKESFATALTAALGEARRGPTQTSFSDAVEPVAFR